MKGNEPVAPVLVRSKNYHWPGIDADPPYKYSRGANPTRTLLEDALIRNEAYEGTIHAGTFASGLGAEAALFLSLSPGDHVLLCDEIYGGTYRLFDRILRRFGIGCDYADFSDYAAARKKITGKTRYIFVEPMSNPSLLVTNMKNVRRLSRATGVPFAVDGTFCPAPSFKAFEWGAETVIYSLSKYFSGHNDCLGGAVLTKDKGLFETLKIMQSTLGAVLSPDECYRIIQGMKSSDIRWKHTSESALTVAEWLSTHRKVKRALYPSLKSHPQYDLAQTQFKKGCGSVVSFELDTADRSKIGKFVNAIIADEKIVFGESLASPETILAYPATMSHKSLSERQRRALGISKGFFRLSVGFGDPQEVITSLDKALSKL